MSGWGWPEYRRVAILWAALVAVLYLFTVIP